MNVEYCVSPPTGGEGDILFLAFSSSSASSSSSSVRFLVNTILEPSINHMKISDELEN